MALTKDQKKAQVAVLTEKLKDAESVIFSHYIGLSVADVSEFRNKLREGGAEMKVAKKTLMNIAFKEAGYPEISPDELDGAVACIFSFADPLSGAQTAFKFSKDHDQVKLVGGVFDGKVLTSEEALELAKMPSREQLLAKFVGLCNSPLTSFASMCTSPLGGFARALDQLAEKGGAGDSPAPEASAEPEVAPEATPTEEPVAEEAPAEAAAEEEKPAEETAPETDAPAEEADATSDDSATEEPADAPAEEEKPEGSDS